jgi:hypothetical protein
VKAIHVAHGNVYIEMFCKIPPFGKTLMRPHVDMSHCRHQSRQYCDLSELPCPYLGKGREEFLHLLEVEN